MGGAGFSVCRPNMQDGTKNLRTPPRTSLSDFSSMVLAIWAGVKVLSRLRRYAAKPATWEVATEVPEMVLVPPYSFQVETTFEPAAKILTGGP